MGQFQQATLPPQDREAGDLKGSDWHLWVPMVVIGLAVAKTSNSCFRIVDCNLLISGEVIFLCGTDMQIPGSQLQVKYLHSTLYFCKVVSACLCYSISVPLQKIARTLPCLFVSSVGALAQQMKSYGHPIP